MKTYRAYTKGVRCVKRGGLMTEKEEEELEERFQHWKKNGGVYV